MLYKVRNRAAAAYSPIPRLCEEDCLKPACTYAVTHPVEKVAQWSLRGIDAHAEEPLQRQKTLGLDITPRGKRRNCSSFIQ